MLILWLKRACSSLSIQLSVPVVGRMRAQARATGSGVCVVSPLGVASFDRFWIRIRRRISPMGVR